MTNVGNEGTAGLLMNSFVERNLKGLWKSHAARIVSSDFCGGLDLHPGSGRGLTRPGNRVRAGKPRRILQDEGVLRCLKIVRDVLKDSMLRQRILAIRRIFRKHKERLGAVSIVGLRTEESV